MSFYPPEVHCRFLAPKFAGRTCTANAAGTGASFKCGCFVRFSMSIDPKIKKILEATYTTNGCGYMAAAADAIAEELSGKILTELGSAGHDGILNAIAAIVGPYPETRQHCASAAAEAVAAAFGDFRAFLIEEFSGEQALLCTCFGVSEKTIEEYVESGLPRTIDDVAAACRAGSGCGSCRMLIQEIIDENEMRNTVQ